MNNGDKIRCCSKHVEYPTPVLFTLKYRGNEYWCPHCGIKYEFFDNFSYYQNSEQFERRKALFEKLSLDFLRDKADTFEFGQKPDMQPSDTQSNAHASDEPPHDVEANE